jgi:hypothetical protein
MSTRVSVFRSIALSALPAACAILALSAPARADIVFTNIVGPCCGGYAVNGSNFGPESIAAAFTPVTSDRLADAQVVVFQILGFGGDPNFNMSLFSDSGGLPGSPIESLGTDLTAPLAPGGIVSAMSALNPALLAGTQYWLVLTPFDNSTQIAWEQGGSAPVMAGFTTSTSGIGGWAPIMPTATAQFEVDGTVPEPASVLLLATALGLIAVVLNNRRRRKRRSIPRRDG